MIAAFDPAGGAGKDNLGHSDLDDHNPQVVRERGFPLTERLTEAPSPRNYLELF
jgi:hypothetical protein